MDAETLSREGKADSSVATAPAATGSAWLRLKGAPSLAQPRLPNPIELNVKIMYVSC